MDAVLQLMNIARHAYLVNIMPELTGDPIMQDKVKKKDNVTILNNSRVTAVLGDNFVTGMTIKTGEKEETKPVQGIFVEIGLIPNSEFVKGVKKNKNGEIEVTNYNETSVPGIFAAGDVTDVPEKQIIIAAGEGAKATLGAFRYLSRLR